MVDKSARGFLLGFIAGEGCFMIEVGDIQRRRWNINISPRFSLLVHEDEILTQLRDEFDLGNVYHSDERSQWSIQSIDGCLELCEVIDNSDIRFFEGTEKYNQYEKWKACLHMINDGEHTTRDGAHKLVDRSFEIGKPGKRKYSKDYYHNRINEAGDYTCDAETKDGSNCSRHVAKPDNNCGWHT